MTDTNTRQDIKSSFSVYSRRNLLFVCLFVCCVVDSSVGSITTIGGFGIIVDTILSAEAKIHLNIPIVRLQGNVICPCGLFYRICITCIGC